MSSQNTRIGTGPRQSRNTLTPTPAIRAVAAQVELVVAAEELTRNGGAEFLGKVEAALAEHPGTLVLNLCNGHHLSTSAVGLLLRVRADAVRIGVRFVCQPGSRDAAELLTSLGLAGILGLAA